MSRRPEWIDARKAIPKAAQAEVFRISGGVCMEDGCTKAGKEIDHIKPVALGGGNEVENLRLLCRAHHAEKTAEDVGVIAQADRKGGRSGQHARRNKAKAAGAHKPIQSPGFRTDIKRPMQSRGFAKAKPQRSATRPVEKRT